jgi:putative transposase
LTHDLDRHHRRSVRLKGHDYAQPGAYFVTVCTRERESVLGRIVDSELRLSPIGEIVERNWHDIPARFPGIALDAFVVMPNHIHGIITVTDARHRRGLINQTPTQGTLTDRPDWILMKSDAMVLGKVVRHFKARITKMIHDSASDTFRWQRNYYEHVIRNDEELDAIRQYILSNPATWPTDENYHP